jgi:molecular chaperone DnaK (HSP70)
VVAEGNLIAGGLERGKGMTEALVKRTGETPNKRELQRQMEQTRESVAETVGEIKQTVNEQVALAKKTVAGVLDYREQFQNEPLVWSLGALSAGFALGYTMGYAHKETKHGKKNSQVAAFTNSLVDELSLVGNSLVMPAVNARIKEMFGFDFSEALASISKTNKKPKRLRAKKSSKRAPARKRKTK